VGPDNMLNVDNCAAPLRDHQCEPGDNVLPSPIANTHGNARSGHGVEPSGPKTSNQLLHCAAIACCVDQRTPRFDKALLERYCDQYFRRWTADRACTHLRRTKKRARSHGGNCEFRTEGLDVLRELDRFESARTATRLAVWNQEFGDL
jgi:hypothetical protein